MQQRRPGPSAPSRRAGRSRSPPACPPPDPRRPARRATVARPVPGTRWAARPHPRRAVCCHSTRTVCAHRPPSACRRACRRTPRRPSVASTPPRSGNRLVDLPGRARRRHVPRDQRAGEIALGRPHPHGGAGERRAGHIARVAGSPCPCRAGLRGCTAARSRPRRLVPRRRRPAMPDRCRGSCCRCSPSSAHRDAARRCSDRCHGSS